MKPKYPFQHHMPFVAMLIAAVLAGCGGGLGDTAPSSANDAVVGAPLDNSTQAAPGMGLLDPVPRYTALAVAAPVPAEEVAGVWVRDENLTDVSPADGTAPSDSLAADGEPTEPAPALLHHAPALPIASAGAAPVTNGVNFDTLSK